MGGDTIQLDSLVEEIFNHPESIRQGNNLTPADKSVINPEDTWEIAFVNSISPQIFKIIDAVLTVDPKYFGNYMGYQKREWCAKQKDFLRRRYGREPTSEEIAADAKQNRLYERYKLCYLLEHPEQIVVNRTKYNRYEEIVGVFLAAACKADPNGRNYLEILDNFVNGAEEVEDDA